MGSFKEKLAREIQLAFMCFWQYLNQRKSKKNMQIEWNIFQGIFKKEKNKTWRDWVSLLNSRLSFYYRLPVEEKCLEKCLSLHILIFEPHNSLLMRDHNVNTSFYKHALCHPANSKSVFLTKKALLIFTRPWKFLIF